MMRDIKFRGKRVDNGEWVYGDLITKKYPIFPFLREPLILDSGGAWEVTLKTVGQYTGLKDKRGTEIYEGDIVRGWGGVSAFGVHEFQGDYTLNDIRHIDYEELGNYDELYIIGNIHDKEVKI